MGDLNSRCATPINVRYQYSVNPDITVNANGRKMLKLCAENDLVIANGLNLEDTQFDSDFTYHRGKLRIQNNWLLTNAVNTVETFQILPKMITSDHSPLREIQNFSYIAELA